MKQDGLLGIMNCFHYSKKLFIHYILVPGRQVPFLFRGGPGHPGPHGKIAYGQSVMLSQSVSWSILASKSVILSQLVSQSDLVSQSGRLIQSASQTWSASHT